MPHDEPSEIHLQSGQSHGAPNCYIHRQRCRAEAKGDSREIGIVVLMFPFGATDGRCNFISNGADRAEIVSLFKEMISRFEGQPATKGRA